MSPNDIINWFLVIILPEIALSNEFDNFFIDYWGFFQLYNMHFVMIPALDRLLKKSLAVEKIVMPVKASIQLHLEKTGFLLSQE